MPSNSDVSMDSFTWGKFKLSDTVAHPVTFSARETAASKNAGSKSLIDTLVRPYILLQASDLCIMRGTRTMFFFISPWLSHWQAAAHSP